MAQGVQGSGKKAANPPAAPGSKGDKKLYESLLREVLSAPDPDANLRLNNAIAKRRAKRYLLPNHEQECSLK